MSALAVKSPVPAPPNDFPLIKRQIEAQLDDYERAIAAYAAFMQAGPREAVDALPKPRYRGAAKSTINALMFSLCQRGASALSERSSQRRLAALSTAQVHEVIERLFAARSRFHAIDDELLFQLSEQLA